jgi:hypothetical protein
MDLHARLRGRRITAILLNREVDILSLKYLPGNAVPLLEA